MDLFDFFEKFPGEKECLAYFISAREKGGIACAKCACTEHRWLADSDRFVCEQCGNQIAIKTGTLMEKSSLPIKYWFVAIALLTSSSAAITATDIRKKFGSDDNHQVNEMLAVLNACLHRISHQRSFEHLLAACIKSENFDLLY